MAFDSNAFDVDAFDELAFLFDGVSPPVVSGQTPAGRAGSRRKRHYYVEIDGQEFLVDSPQQAEAMLQRARSLAEREAEKATDETVSKLSKKPRIPEVRIEAPAIKVSPELQEDLTPLIAEIKRLYEKAAVNAELRLRLERMLADEEEGELLLLL